MSIKLLLATLVAVATLGLSAPVATAHVAATGSMAASGPTLSQPAAKTFKNCTALNKVYRHGVGKPHARDKTTGRPVTTFKKSLPLYQANAKSDRDKDGIACEKQ